MPRQLAALLLGLMALTGTAFAGTAAPEAAVRQCQTLVAYRLGGLMDLTLAGSQPLPDGRWLIQGEARHARPPVQFFCVMGQQGDGWQLSQLELLQLHPHLKER